MSEPSLLRRRDFVLLVVSLALSALGDALAIVALLIRVHDLTRSGFAVSALLLADILAHVLLAPVAGMLVDRLETVKVLAVTAAVQAAVAVGLAFSDTVPLMVGLSFVLGAGGAVATPAVLALVPRVAGEDRTTEANAYLEFARYGGAAGGPALAGALTATLGARSALLADAASFLVLAGAAAALTVRRPPERGGTAAPFPSTRRGEARAGFSFLLRDPLLRLVALVLAITVVFAVMDNVALVFFAKDALRAGDGGYGALLTAWVVGMVAGALFIARRLRASALALGFLIWNLVTGAAVTATAAFPIFGLAMALFLLGGAGNGISNVAMRSLVHHRTPDRLRGRVFAANGALLNTGQLVAIALGGVLVEAMGARGTLLLAGAGTVAVGTAGLVLYRRLPEEARVAPALEPVAPAAPGPGLLPAEPAAPPHRAP